MVPILIKYGEYRGDHSADIDEIVELHESDTLGTVVQAMRDRANRHHPIVEARLTIKQEFTDQ